MDVNRNAAVVSTHILLVYQINTGWTATARAASAAARLLQSTLETQYAIRHVRANITHCAA
jgi:hypothetical protein